ncbi:polyisoprenoid-binding protein [Pseudomonas syringae]|uniref:Polyisoprenoid-binding protein n=1 Tax=Pseudomonas syringae TaxID=317 RepID=A0A9Q3X3N6_PSESX|nr:polyisoprenoid-binding protein [Pseudomonas syringae]MCF5063275.1 polyisoprenoid-binding protein [Pseudomonas syringae]MCF5073889.1 polyisoprenoid-binding protein [Pseudomonas syringae]MCF5119967.1 polyisoprenoid-binding protein [Pseudomonas syringae]MCF5378735.1 polyisoprenoid-binding protein [Pseudomonas syringae]
MNPLIYLAVLLGFCSFAQAAEYSDVNRTASHISFTYTQLGQRVYGTFSDFEGSLRFDTQKPEAGHALLTIRLASIDAGSPDANDELQRASWFDTATYPVGVYESTGVTALGDNRYRISGHLTIKGTTRPVAVDVLLKEQGGIGVFDGEFILKRGDFKIGEGEWAGNSVVSNDINIKFKMVAPQR